jgi:large subunit ribosomal protein L4
MSNFKLDILNNKGDIVSNVTLSEVLFGREANSDLVAQYIRVYLTNQRVGNASTKTRGEVSGSGKKPYKQKGTGNARRSSLRTPLARGGGITFGPKPRNFRLEMPKKMKIGALLNVLSSRLASNNMFILDSFGTTDIKTKQVTDILESIKLAGTKTLIITSVKDDNVLKSARNIDRVSVRMVQNLNAYDVISHKNILFLEDSIKALEDKYETK